MRNATVTLTLCSVLAAGALVAAPSRVAAVAIALPPAPTTQARVTGFLSPTVDLVSAYLIYGLREPPSASGAGVSPFIVALGNPASGVNPFDLAVDDGLCTRSICAFTILALDDPGSDSVLVGMGLGRAGDAIVAGESFSQVFGSDEQALAAALRAGSESVLATFFLDNVGKAAGAGVSPFLPDLAQIRPQANPTPHPDCPPLAAFAAGPAPGANPTPHPDCPGPAGLVSFTTASLAGVANAQTFAAVPAGPTGLLLAAGLLGVLVARAARE